MSLKPANVPHTASTPSYDEFRTLLDQSNQAVVVHRNFELLYANDAFARLVGADSVDDILGKTTLTEFLFIDERPRLSRLNARRMAGEAVPEQYEVRWRRWDGQAIWVENWVKLVEFGGAPAVFVAAVDITRRRRQEQALLRAKIEAETASRAKTQFLANMSHELRTPLNAILGFTELMCDEIFGAIGNARYKRYLEDIHKSARHLLNMINDILDVARIEAGSHKIEDMETDLVDTLGEAFRRAEGNAPGPDMLALDIAPDLEGYKLLADRRALVQIADNLLTNALKFTPADGTVTIGARLIESRIEVSVADTGTGIPAKDLTRILEPFEKVTEDESRNAQGVGLGLSIVRALADLHHATMDVHSEVGKGTTISVVFPEYRTIAPGASDEENAG